MSSQTKENSWEYTDKVIEFINASSTDLVVKDMKQREIFGFKKYNKYLTDKTDEDMLNHLYNELLDAAVYLRTLIEQRKDMEYDPKL